MAYDASRKLNPELWRVIKLSRLAVFAFAAIVAGFGNYALFADPPVNLQSSSPGVAQNGHINVSGNVLARSVTATTASATAVTGSATATSGTGIGGAFTSGANNGTGVSGTASSATGFNYGGLFQSASNNGKGVMGVATNAAGTTYGVHGRAASTAGRGVYGEATSTTGSAYGVYGRSSSLGSGVFGENVSASGSGAGGNFQSASASGFGLLAQNSAGGVGIRAASSGLALQVLGGSSFSGTAAFTGSTPFTVANSNLIANLNADKLDGKDSSDFLQEIPVPLVLNSNDAPPLQVVNTHATHSAIQAYAQGNGGAVHASGVGQGGVGVFAEGNNSGVRAFAYDPGGTALYGYTGDVSSLNYGVYGVSNSATGFGLFASGNSGASGTKSFRIDHPLDPTNKYLLHYSTESPEPQNFYNGNVLTDQKGEAWVQLPDYFQEINRDFRYTLTIVDNTDSADFVMVKVAREIEGNRFKIRTSAPSIKVSWRVDALRNDRWVQKHKPESVQTKQGLDKGTYQNPELYDQPAEKGLNYRLGGGKAPRQQPAKSK